VARPPLVSPITFGRVPMTCAAELVDFGRAEFARIENGPGSAIGTDMFGAGTMARLAVNPGFRGYDAAGGTQRQWPSGVAAKTLQRGGFGIKCTKAGIGCIGVARGQSRGLCGGKKADTVFSVSVSIYLTHPGRSLLPRPERPFAASARWCFYQSVRMSCFRLRIIVRGVTAAACVAPDILWGCGGKGSR
jgi:hypothetical protein